MKRFAGILTAAAVALSANVATAASISGAGATFPFPVYAKWAEAYQKEKGVSLNYQSIGSGGGIKQITAKTVTFGASDAPLKPDQLDKIGLVQWPQIMGGAVPAMNVPGIKPGEVTLDGPTLAQIYLGNITEWDDAAIKQLNPNVKLPSTAIAPVYRSDGSGTNFLFTNYLSKVSDEFKSKVGNATSVQWPTGIGAKGNEGVANMVKRTEGGIGYVEYAYVKQNNMTYAKLKNAAGKAVSPETASFQAAAANADWVNAPGFYLVLTNEPGEQSWPITGASFILMYKKPQNSADARQALDFFSWAFANGDKMAESLDYVPMPAKVVSEIKASWAKDIKGEDGNALWASAK